jgi:beta-glucosidase
MNAATLLPAIRDGKVSEATIDQKVRRILRTAMQFGFFDRDQLDPSVPLYNQEGNATTLQAAEEGAVLLKNQGSLLPLERTSLHTIAVIGPDAYPAVPGAGGSSHTDAFAPVSFMTGLSNAAYPQIKVTWNRGLQPIAEIFSKTRWCRDAACSQPGIERREYSVATNKLIRSSVDQKLNDASGPEWSKPNPNPERIVWSGYYMPATSDSYRFVAHAGGSARYQLSINGKQILKVDQKEGGGAQSASISLTAGHAVKVEYTYFPAWTGSMAQLGVLPEAQLVDAEAIRLAKMADVVVLSVGFGPETESEGFDRTYALPFGQQELIEKIASTNPRTIVVLTSGGSVATEGWIDKVPVLLQTWYAGQQAGNALPKLLFGDVNPSGKLPISWEKSLQDDPAYKNYYEKSGSTDVRYSEGIFLGYRYFETSKIKPLFPFGFGLSYTSFRFSNLSVTPASTSPSGPIHVSFDVTNTGSRAGAEVAQIYVGDPSATVPRPKMELKGFSRVQLAPGKTQHITATLDRRSLAYWDVQSHGWKVDPGKFVVYVGDSSENVPLQKGFEVR